MDLVATHSLMDFERKGAFFYNIAYVLMNVTMDFENRFLDICKHFSFCPQQFCPFMCKHVKFRIVLINLHCLLNEIMFGVCYMKKERVSGETNVIL